MKRLSVLAILPFMMGCSADEQNVATGLSPDANPWPKPYQAVFSVPAGSATLEERRYSDGNGRIRVDVPFDDSRRSINVYNIAKKERLGWTEGTGEYLIEPLKLDELPHFNAERLQAMAAQSLGEKIIDGHSCCGFGGPQGEVWVDSRFGIPVLSTTGGASIKLVSLSETPPDPSLFEIPSGYHKMQTSQ